MIVEHADNKLFKADIFYNDKIVILTTLKIGHSKCREIFLGNQNSEIDSQFIINSSNFNLKPGPRESNSTIQSNYDDSIFKIWNNFLKKEEKRELIILYRNPKEHLISAFMQDFFYVSENNNFGKAFIDLFLNTLNYDNHRKLEFKDKLLRDGINKELFKNYPSFTKPIINILLEYYLTRGEYLNINGHYTKWNTSIYLLYNSNLIDLHKIKFVDIYDNPIEIQLSNYLENYNVELNINDWKRHSYLFDYITNMILNISTLNKIVNGILEYEFVFYNKIKSDMQHLI